MAAARGLNGDSCRGWVSASDTTSDAPSDAAEGALPESELTAMSCCAVAAVGQVGAASVRGEMSSPSLLCWAAWRNKEVRSQISAVERRKNGA